MAATVLTVQTAPHTGLDISYSTPTQTDGHTAPTGGGIGLLVKNTSGGVTVTLVTPGTVDGLAVADRTVTVTAGHDELIPLPYEVYGDPATGLVTFNLSAFANTTMACVRVA